MSCSIYRKSDSVVAPTIVWRSAGDSFVAQDVGTADSSNDSDSQTAYQRGWQEGHAAAESESSQEIAAKLQPVLRNLSSVIDELASTRKRFRVEAEEATVNLAIAIARRILHREIATDPEAILGVVRSSFDRLNAREVHRLRLNALDADVIKQNRSELSLPSSVEIVTDDSLRAGSAVFDTVRGELDISVSTQLEEIERGFADIVRKRKQ